MVSVVAAGPGWFNAAMAHADTLNVEDPKLIDQVIQLNVEKRLRLDDRIAWGSLVVHVQQKKVLLFGEVRTVEEKGLATGIASAIPGVQALYNKIIVDPNLPIGSDSSKGVIDSPGRDKIIEGPNELKEKQIMP